MLMLEHLAEHHGQCVMPNAPLRVCSANGCSMLVNRGYCQQHQRQRKAVHQRHVKGQPGLNYGRRWKRVRAQFLAEHPFCATCEESGQMVVATDVDHIVPHKGDPALFWNQDNYQSLCQSCHSRKTWSETQVGGTRNVQA